MMSVVEVIYQTSEDALLRKAIRISVRQRRTSNELCGTVDSGKCFQTTNSRSQLSNINTTLEEKKLINIILNTHRTTSSLLTPRIRKTLNRPAGCIRTANKQTRRRSVIVDP